ncbi:MAG: ligase-associated DNA damage response endonuclease PdeM [Flavobacteriia bacterium]|nr:ligase-associated DNA damage response endonuclease PdeM [Flavobacteriia bacterium]
MKIVLQNEDVEITAERTLWFERKQTLFLSDVHLGKATHFRKAGMYISGKTGFKDLDRIAFQLRHFQPNRIVFLGDLFHSEYNQEWEAFIDLRNHFKEVEFILIEGNHDIMDLKFYERAGVKVIEEGYIEDGWEWRHHPSENPVGFQICGHIHPGVRIRGKARQSLTLPCFVHEPNRFIFPAFGRLTGKVRYEGANGSRYYAIAGSEILEVVNQE